MKTFILLSILFSQILFAQNKPEESLIVPEGCNKTKGWGYFCKFNLEFTKKQNISATGKIGGLEPVSIDPKMSDGVLLKLKVADQIVEFLLGPEWYLNNLDEVLYPGDEISIQGIQGYYQGKLWNRVFSMRKNDRMIEFIHANGQLVWSAWQPQPKEFNPMKKTSGKPKGSKTK